MPPVFVDIAALLADPDARSRRILWSSTTQLQANVVRLEPGARVDPHAESSLDVLLVVVGGSGTLATAERAGPPLAETAVSAPALVVLPTGTVRSLTAGPAGLAYVTAHRRRPGLTPTLRDR